MTMPYSYKSYFPLVKVSRYIGVTMVIIIPGISSNGRQIHEPNCLLSHYTICDSGKINLNILMQVAYKTGLLSLSITRDQLVSVNIF